MKVLKIHVERIVRPLRASPLKKLRLREELLSHLQEIYQEERGGSGDEPGALERTLKRFGEPAALTREFQASVPALERFFQSRGRSPLDSWFARRPAEGLVTFFWRQLLPINFGAVLALTVEALANGFEAEGSWQVSASFVLLLNLLYSIQVLVWPKLLKRLEADMLEKRRGRVALSGLLAGGNLSATVAVLMVWAFWSAGQEWEPELIYRQAGSCLLLPMVVAVALVLVSSLFGRTFDQLKRIREWEALEIEG